MSSYNSEKELKEKCFKKDVVESEIEHPIVHIRTKRSDGYIKHEIPAVVRKIETHVYYHYYEYVVKECIEHQCEHVYLTEDR